MSSSYPDPAPSPLLKDEPADEKVQENWETVIKEEREDHQPGSTIPIHHQQQKHYQHHHQQQATPELSHHDLKQLHHSTEHQVKIENYPYLVGVAAPPGVTAASAAAAASALITPPITIPTLTSSPWERHNSAALTPTTEPSPPPFAFHGEPASSNAPPVHMSNTQPPPHGHTARPPLQQQHVGYHGHQQQPAQYPPAAPMTSSPYPYPGMTTQAPSDPYRQQQPLPSSSVMSLPSMRSLDPIQQQQQQHQHAMSMAPMATAYYNAPPHMGMNPYGMGPDLRFAMPMTDPRVAMSGGRHKKEIKRRTKTGCLTCRKRRIKCDEAHPTCNNCKKSKRDCAGYDPIFKQNPLAASSAVGVSVPATVAGAVSIHSHAHTHTSHAHVQHHHNPGAVQPPPRHLLSGSPSLSGVANPYANPPPAAVVPSNSANAAYPGAPAAAHHQYDPPPVTTSSLPLASVVAVDYPVASLDPALDTAKTMKIDELCALSGPAPPPPQTPPTRETLDEILKVYYEIYVPGLSSFFETHWYNFKPTGPNSSSVLTGNASVINLFTAFLDTIKQPKESDAAQIAAAGIIEMRLVWALAALAYSVPAATNPAGDDPLPPDDSLEARNRLAVFEALLSGTYLAANPCVPPPRRGDPHRVREAEFWYNLAESLRLHPGGGDAASSQREAALTRIRTLLDGRENRDVLYSIAMLRELSPKVPSGFQAQLPQHLDEGDPRNRLAVAVQFIKDESRVSGGTTNVVRRIAELAIKAFITPGVNVARRVP